ncbi:hypothetical protein FBU59_002509 [Linderina macrospora]|uniref:Uncharacterized protein n=1 Tax=Linderina macrospora TaxID=4868 RepID=A0ACC1JAZ2_9FUNG|nr:hypothetical protein FBU59_002509 [Linderina macrospora]
MNLPHCDSSYATCNKPIDTNTNTNTNTVSSTQTLFCSPACIYSDALDRHRRKAVAASNSLYFNADGCGGSPLPPPPPRISTSTLIRRGIDPWSAPDEIALRQSVGRMLAEALAVHGASPSNAENSWAIENEAYRLSYRDAYTADAMVASSQYYRCMSMVLVSRLRTERSLVLLLAAGRMPPDMLCRRLACE